MLHPHILDLIVSGIGLPCLRAQQLLNAVQQAFFVGFQFVDCRAVQLQGQFFQRSFKGFQAAVYHIPVLFCRRSKHSGQCRTVVGQCVQILRDFCVPAAVAPFDGGLPAFRAHLVQRTGHQIGVIQHAILLEICAASVGSALFQIGKIFFRQRPGPVQNLAGNPAPVFNPGKLFDCCWFFF